MYGGVNYKGVLSICCSCCFIPSPFIDTISTTEIFQSKPQSARTDSVNSNMEEILSSMSVEGKGSEDARYFSF